MFVSHPSASGQKVLEAFPDAGPLLDQLRSSTDGFVDGGPALFNAQASQPWRGPPGGWLRCRNCPATYTAIASSQT